MVPGVCIQNLIISIFILGIDSLLDSFVWGSGFEVYWLGRGGGGGWVGV